MVKFIIQCLIAGFLIGVGLGVLFPHWNPPLHTWLLGGIPLFMGVKIYADARTD